MAEQLLHPLLPVVLGKPCGFPFRPGVDAVKDGWAQGAAVFVHRQAVGAQGAGPYTGHLLRGDAAFLQELFGYLAEIPPPDAFCVVLEPAGLGVFHGVGDADVGGGAEVLPDEHAAGFKGPDVHP